jgi:glutamate 5-kinase
MTKFSWQRAVLKVGSALVSPIAEQLLKSSDPLSSDNIDAVNSKQDRYILQIADFIAFSVAQGKEVILVSSGSIALARSQIKTGMRATIAEKQAMAALGQTSMMANWANVFADAKHSSAAQSIACAQVLVTVEDFADRKRFVNIKNTLETLLKNKALPIVNENDTVAVDEIKVGDNDNLAAHTAIAAQADCLIICTDVDGLYTANPRTDSSASLIAQVDKIDSEIMSLAGGAGTAVGTGGMITKLEAAQKCTQSGIQTLLINGKRRISFKQLKQGTCNGTWFAPVTGRKRKRQDWLTHTSKVRGQLVIDDGAKHALMQTGASLLAVGINSVGGRFAQGDSVEIVHQDALIGKGLVNYSSTELRRIAGCNSNKIDEILGYSAGEAVVHRDNLVIT